MKKIHKLTCLLILVIVFTINTFGQQIGVTARGGISRIYGQLESNNYSSSSTTTSFSPSFQAGIYYNLPTGNKTSLGAELLYSKVQGGQTLKWYNKDVVMESFGTDFTDESISYISLPVYYGVTFKRLTVNAGVQISYALSGSGSSESNYETREGDENTGYISRKFSSYHELNDLPIRNFDFGPRVGGTLQLTDRLSLEGMFYYGLSNINQLKSSEEALKVQQMTVGVRYALWSLY